MTAGSVPLARALPLPAHPSIGQERSVEVGRPSVRTARRAGVDPEPALTLFDLPAAAGDPGDVPDDGPHGRPAGPAAVPGPAQPVAADAPAAEVDVRDGTVTVVLHGDAGTAVRDQWDRVLSGVGRPGVRRMLVDAAAVDHWSDESLRWLAGIDRRAARDGVPMVVTGLGAAHRVVLHRWRRAPLAPTLN